MKIISYTSSEGLSGGVQQALHQTRALRARGHDAVLCAVEHSPLFSLVRENWLVPLPKNDTCWRAVIEAHFGDGPTVVHAFHNRAVKLAAWWGLFWRKRGVASVAHRGIITRPKNPLPYLSPGVAFFLPNSQACARSLNMHCPPWKIRVVPNGLPSERIKPARSPHEVRAELKLPEGGLNLMYVGNDNPVKGAGLLLQAFAQACADLPSARLILLGVRPNNWLSQVMELGLTERVHMHAPDPCVSDYLQLADAFVFPSTGMDSAPNVLLEAMGMGLPVVSSDVGGCPEIINGNGLLVPSGKVSALADAIRCVCLDEEKRREWARQSLALAPGYSMDERCRKLEAVYEDALRPLNR